MSANEKITGQLLLCPNSLGEEIHLTMFCREMIEAIADIDGLIAESEKRARRFLKPFSFSGGRVFRDIPICLLNKHSNKEDLKNFIIQLKEGKKLALISDCGLPCVADPGSRLVFACRQEKIPIKAFSGPSSIYSALMLSGLGGQSFHFHGYFPKKTEECLKKIGRLIKQQEKCTHLFIEAPYRNRVRLQQLIANLPANIFLSVACHLSLPDEMVMTKSIDQWKKDPLPDIHKKPAIFLLR